MKRGDGPADSTEQPPTKKLKIEIAPPDEEVKKYIIDKGWQDLFKNATLPEIRGYSRDDLLFIIQDRAGTASFFKFLHPEPQAQAPARGIHRFFLSILGFTNLFGWPGTSNFRPDKV
jgi:hypothetical protein